MKTLKYASDSIGVSSNYCFGSKTTNPPPQKKNVCKNNKGSIILLKFDLFPQPQS